VRHGVEFIVLRVTHLIVTIFLLFACMFWLILLRLLVGPAFSHGLKGVHEKLVHIWMMGRFGFDMNCSDRLRIIHEGYTSLILLLISTWLMVEIERILRRRIRRNSIP